MDKDGMFFAKETNRLGHKLIEAENYIWELREILDEFIEDSYCTLDRDDMCAVYFGTKSESYCSICLARYKFVELGRANKVGSERSEP